MSSQLSRETGILFCLIAGCALFIRCKSKVLWQLKLVIVLQLNLWWSGLEQLGCLCQLFQLKPSNRLVLHLLFSWCCCFFIYIPHKLCCKCQCKKIKRSCINGCFLQVAPKPLTSAAVVTTTQTQQRLIMPATPLPQIQPNFTNLPPGTVLAQAPGGGNVGYAIVPAQYVTQVSVCVCVFVFVFITTVLMHHYFVCMCLGVVCHMQQPPFVTLASSSSFSTSTGVQSQARMPLNG